MKLEELKKAFVKGTGSKKASKKTSKKYWATVQYSDRYLRRRVWNVE